MPRWLLVSPVSRGIGFALAQNLLRNTSLPLVGTARRECDPVKEAILKGLKDKNGQEVDPDRLHVVQVAMDEEDSMAAASRYCSEQFAAQPRDDPWYLHLGFVLPGILYPEKSPKQVDFEHAKTTFVTNTIGPLLMTKHFEGFLPKKSATPYTDRDGGLPGHATWAMMSARVGSITDNKLGGWYTYRASKAAVNQIAKTFDNHLKASSGSNAMAISMHPGTVKTGLSKEFWNSVREEKLFAADFAAERLLGVINGAHGNIDAYRGKLWDWEGKEVPP